MHVFLFFFQQLFFLLRPCFFSHWDFSSDSEGVCSRGSDMLLWRSHSLWSSVASFSLLLVPLSRKLARGGRTFTPFTVTEPSMALRSCVEKDGTVRWRVKTLQVLYGDRHFGCSREKLWVRQAKMLQSDFETSFSSGFISIMAKDRRRSRSCLLCCAATVLAPVEIELLTPTQHRPRSTVQDHASSLQSDSQPHKGNSPPLGGEIVIRGSVHAKVRSGQLRPLLLKAESFQRIKGRGMRGRNECTSVNLCHTYTHSRKRN